MEEVQSLYEKKIDAMMCKMFGDADSQLKAITKMTLMNTVLTDEMKQTLIALRDQAIKDAEMINAEMTLTYDASGNTVPVEELSPRQQDIKITYHDTVEEDDRDN
jgi:hypothetical protein